MFANILEPAQKIIFANNSQLILVVMKTSIILSNRNVMITKL